jgi:hypothetical protein
MKRKVLLTFIAMTANLGLLMACSDDSSDGDSLVNVHSNTLHLKVESYDFKASSCKDHLAKWADGVGEEYIDFYINDDGSATVNLETGVSCDGFYSMIYETRNDTLFAVQNYTRFLKDLDSLSGDSIIVGLDYHMSHCSCLVDLELIIPSPLVGTKYVDFEGDCRSIVYKKR